ncbi:PAAR domain-containing protein [Endozoicomonas sp. SM1973]|uniref:PAAR domain-containing protein n=1 Tax=Spartinivicinus marinus TaxID=2994442 RepID=A0A853I316_9GAMM|nr:PAAR domain-containing protein [Spartinivicinus marinus]MCX4029630.1 PAAR domain-containing protein [Spartinivicinus marinus]NYZ66989.1 PAAR domain-containing protein [Spartinivicinus marinus]
MGMPAATVEDLYTCPKLDPGPTPHLGRQLKLASPSLGSLNVLISGKQAALGETLFMCGSQGDNKIVNGSTTVKINGKPAGRKGDVTAHGGVIVQGVATVLIGG